MIQVENILMDAFSNVSAVEGVDNPLFFHFGEQKELDSVIQTRQENQKYTYPLLWYLMPNEIQGNERYAEGDLSFVLAHNTQLEWFNDQRFQEVFNQVLQPNFDLVLDTLKRAAKIESLKLSNGMLYKYTNYPNYGVPDGFTGGEEAQQINFWDAMKFTIRLRFYSDYNC